MPKTDPLDAYIDAAAAALAIPVAPEWKGEIRANLASRSSLPRWWARRSCRTMPSPRNGLQSLSRN